MNLDPARVGRDAGRIADEVIAHLAGLVGSTVTVTLEIEAMVEAQKAGKVRHSDHDHKQGEDKQNPEAA